MADIKAAVVALVESNFAMSKFLDLIKVALEAIFGIVAEEV